MATFESLKKEMKKLVLAYDEFFFEKEAKGLGPSLCNRDAIEVSGSDKLEMVKQSFLIGKLGLQDGLRLDEVIQKVLETMDKSIINKQRTIFYYLLVEHFAVDAKY